MQEQMSAKQHSHTMLIDLEAYLNLQVGWALHLREKIRTGECSASDFNVDFLKQDPPDIIDSRNTDPDFLMRIFPGLEYDEAYRIYQDEMKNPEVRKAAISLAPTVRTMDKVVNLFQSRTGQTMGKAVVLVTNREDGASVKFAHPSLPVVEEYETGKINFKRFCRLIIADIDRVFDFPQIVYTHIAVLDYPRNFEVIEGKKVLKRAPILAFSVQNEFEIIKPF